MAIEQSRFFDSVSKDRRYSADEFAEYFRVLVTDGILNGGTSLQVYADGSGLQVFVRHGVAMAKGYMYWLKDDGGALKSLQVSAPAAQPRIDRVVLRLDKSTEERSIKIMMKTGTPAANPQPPALEREGNVYELSLAQVRVRVNTPSITAQDVTDERYEQDVCGLMNGLIGLDSSDFYQQAMAAVDAIHNLGADAILSLIAGRNANFGEITVNKLSAGNIIVSRTEPPVQEGAVWIKY